MNMYRIAASDDTKWTTARTSAESRTYNGTNGYLATITSVEENDFITSKCGGAGWLGASDLGSVTGAANGVWEWVTGPESGTKFSTLNLTTLKNTLESDQFNNWAVGEPNNNGSEYYLHIMSGTGGKRPGWASYSVYPAGSWNDYANNTAYGNIFGYIVEYETTYIDISDSYGLAGTSTITIEPPLEVLVDGNPTSCSENATLFISSPGDGSGIKSVTVNGTDITDSYLDGFFVTENGMYTVVIVSNEGRSGSMVVNVSMLDITRPNEPVIKNQLNFLPDKIYGTNQTVSAEFAATPGCAEKLQYSLDDGMTWIDGPDVEISKDGITNVYFRVIDELSRWSSMSTVAIVHLDKTGPAAPIVKDIDTYSAQISGTAEPGSTINIKDEAGSILGTATADEDGKFTVDISRQKANTILFVFAEDAYGNQSSATKVTVQDALEYINKMIDALPDPKTASDSEITNLIKSILETKRRFDLLSDAERKNILIPRKEKLNDLISRLNSFLVIEPRDTATGIFVTSIGTSVFISELDQENVGKVLISLAAEPVRLDNEATRPENISTAMKLLYKNGKTMLSAYDITLLKSIYNSDGVLEASGRVNNADIFDQIRISIPIPKAFAENKDLLLVYINKEGEITELASQIQEFDGIKYIVFSATHFSQYAIVSTANIVESTEATEATQPNTSETIAKTTTQSTRVSPKTGDDSPIVPLLIVFAVSGASAVVLISKSKKVK
ncbi:MAG: Ig-like domain-containing protein [Lachnospiraceae bacterium]